MIEKNIQIVFGSLIFTFVYIYIILKKIKDIKTIQMRPDDEIIKGKVIGRKPFLLTGDIRPLVLCNINGSKVMYTYRHIYNEKKYPVGTEVELKVSNISGLPYDKKDMMKDILLHLFFLLICSLGTGVGLYVIIFMR